MPLLIDGNNVIYALLDAGQDVGRVGLCRLLSRLAEQGETVAVVFDGPPPPGGMSRQIELTGVEVSYSAGRSADEVIFEKIAENSAPRRLTVVSSDREIRKAARRRQCRRQTSAEFAEQLIRLVEQPPSPAAPQPPELQQKRRGLTEEETQQWLKEFGLD